MKQQSYFVYPIYIGILPSPIMLYPVVLTYYLFPFFKYHNYHKYRYIATPITAKKKMFSFSQNITVNSASELLSSLSSLTT